MELLHWSLIYSIIPNYVQRCTFANFIINNKYEDENWNDDFELDKRYALIQYDICGDYKIYQENELTDIYKMAKQIYEKRYINVKGHATRLLLLEKANDTFRIADDEINTFSAYSTTFAEMLSEDVNTAEICYEEANRMYHEAVEQELKLKNNQL